MSIPYNGRNSTTEVVLSKSKPGSGWTVQHTDLFERQAGQISRLQFTRQDCISMSVLSKEKEVILLEIYFGFYGCHRHHHLSASLLSTSHLLPVQRRYLCEIGWTCISRYHQRVTVLCCVVLSVFPLVNNAIASLLFAILMSFLCVQSINCLRTAYSHNVLDWAKETNGPYTGEARKNGTKFGNPASIALMTSIHSHSHLWIIV